MLLPGSEVIDNVSEVGIDLIVMFEILVHLVGLLLKPRNFHLSRGDVSLELFDFVVKHELELL